MTSWLQQEPIGEAPSETPSIAPQKSLNILVAEDNPVNAQVISGMLKKLGHSFSICEDGELAVSRYSTQHNSFDVILMDCEMPVVDGFAATRAIRAYEEQHHLAKKPIIALTAHALVEFQQRCYEAGMDDYLTKPLAVRELAAALHKLNMPHAPDTRPAPALAD